MKNKKYIIILGIIILAVVGYNLKSSGHKITTEDIFDPVKMEAAKEEASPEACNSMFLSVYEVFKSKFLAVMLVEDVKQCYAKLGYESRDNDVCKDIEIDISKGFKGIMGKEYNGNSEAYYWCMGGVAAKNRDGGYVQGMISDTGGNLGKYTAEGMGYAVDSAEECEELLEGGGDMSYESEYMPRVPSEFSCYFGEAVRANDNNFCAKIKNDRTGERCVYYFVVKNRTPNRCYFDECKAQYALATGDISACRGDSECEAVAKRYLGDIDINVSSQVSDSKDNFGEDSFLSKFFSFSQTGSKTDCEIDDDCERGNYCYKNKCIDNCTYVECGDNQYCELGICECEEGYKRCKDKNCVSNERICTDDESDEVNMEDTTENDYNINNKKINKEEAKVEDINLDGEQVKHNYYDKEFYNSPDELALAKDKERIQTVRRLQTALELFYNDQGFYPESVDLDKGIFFGSTIYYKNFLHNPQSRTSICLPYHDYKYKRISDRKYEIYFCLERGFDKYEIGMNVANKEGISRVK